jgi:hypothetical protein
MTKFATGSEVKGNYFNVPFTGVVTHIRPHCINDNVVIHIDLYDEVEVFGEKRAAIAMEVNCEGCAAGYPGLVTMNDAITAYYTQSSGHGQPVGAQR